MPRIPHITWTTPRVAALAGVSLIAGTALVGVAYAQTPAATPTRQQKAEEHLSRFAQNLGVTPAQVREAMKKTALQYVDEALAAGRITADQAQAMRDRIISAEFGAGFGHGFGGGPRERAGMHRGPGGPGDLRGGAFGPALGALAQFLGITPEQLRTESNGKSLTDVAAAHGKSADALKEFIVTSAQQRLNEAVSAGKIDQARATQVLDALKARLDDFISRAHQQRQFGPGMAPGMGGPRGLQGSTLPSGM